MKNSLYPKTLGLKHKLADVCRRNDVVFWRYFGSYVRGDQHRGSDVDIAFEFNPNKEKTLLNLIHLENELAKIFKRKVDLGIFSSLHSYIIGDVKKEMLVIYER